MNRRKAGEDFYFIHKCMPVGGIGEINSTTIHPSDRVSYRVPFGTGHAIDQYLRQADTTYLTYHPKTFEDLSYINKSVAPLWANKTVINPPPSLEEFYDSNDFHASLETIFHQSNTLQNFKKRYYAWWDGFKVLKYIHHCRDHFYPKTPLDEALNWLDLHHEELNLTDLNKKQQLLQLREFDKQQHFYVRL